MTDGERRLYGEHHHYTGLNYPTTLQRHIYTHIVWILLADKLEFQTMSRISQPNGAALHRLVVNLVNTIMKISDSQSLVHKLAL